MINDGCHGLGAKINNSTGYAIKYADFVTYSFHPVKSITTGEGGAIITNNKSIDIRIKKLRSHGITRNTQKYLWHNDMQQLGYNYRITDFQCALGSSQLRKLDKFVKSRKSIALFYDKNFKNFDNVEYPRFFQTLIALIIYIHLKLILKK